MTGTHFAFHFPLDSRLCTEWVSGICLYGWKEWITLGIIQKMTIPLLSRNVTPGKYTFKIKARLKNGGWNEDNIVPLHIIVNPPFWRAWYAYLFYTLLALILIYFIFRSYKKRLLLQNFWT